MNNFSKNKILNFISLTFPSVLISLFVCFVFYPGFMSYDTLHALRGARNGVVDSAWPPMVSYIWRSVDLVSTNPSAMHFFQVFILVSSIFYIIYHNSNKISLTVFGLFLYLSFPAILGTLAVIWKDVLMAAFFLASHAIIIFMRSLKSNVWFLMYFIIVIFMIFLGISSRHNAIFGAFPLLFYLVYVSVNKLNVNKGKVFYIAALTFVLSGGLYGFKSQLDHYSLPGFHNIQSATTGFIESVRVLDIAGASICVGENLYADINKDLTVNDIKTIYDPKHVNLSAGLFEKVGVDHRINKIWIDTLLNHPVCFFYNKYYMTYYLIGLNSGKQFLITAPAIDENEYGYKLEKSTVRDSFVNYITNISQFFVLKPWFIWLVALCIFVVLGFKRKLTLDLTVLYTSSFMYFLGLFLFGNASDARLAFFTTTGFIVFILICVVNWSRDKYK